jgi:hypothetical protein
VDRDAELHGHTNEVCSLQSSILERKILSSIALRFLDHLVDLVAHERLQIPQTLRVTKGQMSIPFAHRSDLLVQSQRVSNCKRHLVQRCVHTGEVVEVNSENDFADSSGTELEHVLVDVPGRVG